MHREAFSLAAVLTRPLGRAVLTRPLGRAVGMVAVLAMSPAAVADVVHFTNGDRLTGTLVDGPADFVAIEVPQVGVVTVPRARVERVDEAPPQPDEAVRDATTSTTSTIPSDPSSRWQARADLGVAVATGNTRAADLNFVAGVERHGARFDNVLGVAVHKARAQADARRSDLGTTTTKDHLDVDYNLRWKYGETWYAVANFEYFRDPIKDIDQRATTGAGVGHTFWESERGSLRTDAGISRVFEEFRFGLLTAAEGSKESDNNPALRWGLQFNRWLVVDRLELFHNNQLLHILDNEPSSVWDSDTGIRFHVNSRWLAALRVDLQHETAPSAGRRKTDSSYAVAVGVKL
ncbi:MAG: DUF481 domain-containing protein [Gammaproteobacteria bacterium]|nr:DUF481 domain-containing protein [Gammaproteobacteria bacterium]MYF28919.1 DUF481 domain-containing protein [Gammaproteobacteria bacterium]MYK46990.1 DUF481 domain-containing protein [Gammaproteobacteria bacterium]